MKLAAVIIVAAAVFGLCYLADKGFVKVFRSQAQHKSGLSVRLSKRYGSIGLLVAVLGVAALIVGIDGKEGWALPVCGIAAEVIMVAGYCAYDTILTGSLAVGLTGVPGNLVQGAFGVAASTLLAMTLKKSAYVRRAFPEL